MNTGSNRPPGHKEKRELYLTRLAKELEQIITRAYGSLTYNTLCLSNSKLEELAGVLVEFAEDVHNDIGIWKSLELYNVEFFGIPLPFVLKTNEDMGSETINKYRIQHLLWILYSELSPELLLSPTHRDLKKLSTVIAAFLKKRFSNIPQGSSVKEFLSGSNRFGWEVKRKLIWLGTRSYLFRNSFRNYVQDNGGKSDIHVIDDFICQIATAWSGLGVIDILALILDIPEEQRTILRSWYERHTAYYRVLANEGHKSEVMNLINDKLYTARYSADKTPFEVSVVIFGSLLPWNGEWYWSGVQYQFRDITEEYLQEQIDAFVKKSPQITYRYCSELAEKAKKSIERHYHEFMKKHDTDIVVYPDGLSMMADYQKDIRLQWESQPREVIAEVMEKYKLKDPSPSFSVPHDLIENTKGIGFYFNPDEGQEIMTGFHDIISGFKKKGLDLNEDEEEGLLSFVKSNSISPKFVRRLIQEYGFESIESVFLIRNALCESNIDYLLRRYKGTYYRRRYSRIALV
ncbi:DUF3843 family protein [Chloroflexota bacterium]